MVRHNVRVVKCEMGSLTPQDEVQATLFCESQAFTQTARLFLPVPGRSFFSAKTGCASAICHVVVLTTSEALRRRVSSIQLGYLWPQRNII
jgi:hypothetical protein